MTDSESPTPKKSIPARFPKWLRQKLPLGRVFAQTDNTIKIKGFLQSVRKPLVRIAPIVGLDIQLPI